MLLLISQHCLKHVSGLPLVSGHLETPPLTMRSGQVDGTWCNSWEETSNFKSQTHCGSDLKSEAAVGNHHESLNEHEYNESGL